jgi:hypothetical protein
MPETDPAPLRQPALINAEARGKQVLLYTPDGALGGSFTCARCRAVALQPDLLVHASDCRYSSGIASITVW